MLPVNIGIRLHDTAPGTLRQRLGFARAQGFSCAHIALAMTVPGFAMDRAPELLTDTLAGDIRAALAENQMDCAVLGCYLNLANPDPEARRRTQEIYKAHLRFAVKIGAGVVGTETYAHPGTDYDPPAARSEEAFQLFIESLRPVVRAAEECGAILAVEPVWHHIISTPARAQRMLEAVPSDNLQIILDTVNLISPDTATPEQAQTIIADAVARLGDRVRVLHMKDYQTFPGEVRSMACGTGCLDYRALLAFAKAKNLPMTLEDTKPDNAEAARLYLERQAAG